MTFLASECDLIPSLSLDTAHDANGLLLVLQDWALFDMCLEIRGCRPIAAAFATVADALQLAA